MGAGEGNAIDEERERMFEEFWAAYPDRCPRKVDKARCRQLYAGLVAAAPDASSFHAKALAALKRCDMSEMWNKEDGKYICAPCKWLEKSPGSRLRSFHLAFHGAYYTIFPSHLFRRRQKDIPTVCQARSTAQQHRLIMPETRRFLPSA